jgi:hypothetical protein
MLRTIVGLSVVLALASAIACSSKSTNDKGTGGNGALIGGSAGTGGTTASGAGTTSGGTTGACSEDTPITCVDATMASGCNPETGKVDTFSCVEELGALGIVSSGCTKDAIEGDGCAFDDFADQACADGTAAFAYCENATTDEQVFNIYVNCFQDNMDGHTVIPCFAQHVTPEMRTSADCLAAEDACLGTGTGGTGSGGTSAGGTAGSTAQAGADQGGDSSM